MLFRPRPIQMPPKVGSVCLALTDAGYQAYVVGGAVRDCLRGLTPKDWDIATDALPDQVEQLFPQTTPTGKRFGTITVVHKNQQIEVTTLREEGRYTDRRRPESVSYTDSILKDLQRRDFTCNAIAFDTKNNRYIDPHKGISDIRHKRLRAVGQASARFQEDPLRILRLIRFVATLKFTPDEKCLQAIHPQSLSAVSWERIRDEWSKLLLANHIEYPFELMYTTGILKQIVPELADCAQVYQGTRHRYDVLGHLIKTAEAIKPELHLRLAALFHDIAKPTTKRENNSELSFHGHDRDGAEMTRVILSRFRYSKQEIAHVATLVRWHMFTIQPHSTDKAIRRFIAKVGRAHIFDLLELRRADMVTMRINPRQALDYGRNLQARINEVLTRDHIFTVSDLAVNGRDLMEAFSLKPGPLVGKLLSHLLEQVLEDPECNQKDQLRNLAAIWLKENCPD